MRRGQPPDKPRPLPATPQWAPSFSPRALVVAGASATVRAAWQPVAAAEHYGVEVTRGRRQIDVLFSERVPASIDSLEMRGLPPGDYFVSVVAIDADEFESIPSELRRLTVLELGARAGHVIEANTSKMMLGATLRAPSGTRCATEGGELAAAIELTSQGSHTITCERDEGNAGDGDEARLTTSVEVIKPTLRLTGPDADAPSLRQGSLGAVDIAFEPGLPPDVVARSAQPMLEARPLQVGPDRLRVNLTASRDATPGQALVELRYRDIVLGSFEVSVEPAEALTVVGRQAPPEAEYLLSALVGYDAVGASPYWGEDFPVAGASAEVGLGSAPTRHFAAELRAGLGLHPGQDVETVVTLRAQALAGWFDNLLAPHLAVGVSWQGIVNGDSRFSPRIGLGVMPSLSQRFRLRGELGVDVTPIGGTPRLLPEARLGVALSF